MCETGMAASLSGRRGPIPTKVRREVWRAMVGNALGVEAGRKGWEHST